MQTINEPDSPPALLADLSTLWDYLTVATTPQRVDVLFCFGSFYFGVARRAAALYEHDLAPWILVTGGNAGRIPPHATEADGYAAVLCECGVPPDRVVVERGAKHTGENVALGMRALRRRGVRVASAGLVAWPTSLRRCVATFARQFPRVVTRPYPAFDGFGPYTGAPTRAAGAVLAELARRVPEVGIHRPAGDPGIGCPCGRPRTGIKSPARVSSLSHAHGKPG